MSAKIPPETIRTDYPGRPGRVPMMWSVAARVAPSAPPCPCGGRWTAGVERPPPFACDRLSEMTDQDQRSSRAARRTRRTSPPGSSWSPRTAWESPRPRVPGRDGSDEESSNPADLVEQPAKVMRIGSMIKNLLDEVRNAPLDEAGRTRLAEIHRRSIEELKAGLAPELVEELDRLALPFSPLRPPTPSSDRPGAAGRLARGTVPRHPDRALRPADGGPAAAAGYAARPAPGSPRRGGPAPGRARCRRVAHRAPERPGPASTSDACSRGGFSALIGGNNPPLEVVSGGR